EAADDAEGDDAEGDGAGDADGDSSQDQAAGDTLNLFNPDPDSSASLAANDANGEPSFYDKLDQAAMADSLEAKVKRLLHDIAGLFG
ncbi:MAG TPA: hypothetical protein VNR18_03410, partial [Hyphomicrobiales bacterium]|nr:hypothetical protein [Hyphomicrobiales bacterium]